ncbi:MAG TPA: hypothetical protein VI341_02725 [Actinomycetota bacterium]
MVRSVGRWVLAGSLVFTGVAHFVMTETFERLVPPWVPAPTAIVWITGVMELGFAVALVATPPGPSRRRVGLLLAVFLALVFVGNVYQAVAGVEAFGLDTDAERWGRLVFQPLLIVWALWVCEGLGQDPATGGDEPGGADAPSG